MLVSGISWLYLLVAFVHSYGAVEVTTCIGVPASTVSDMPRCFTRGQVDLKSGTFTTDSKFLSKTLYDAVAAMRPDHVIYSIDSLGLSASIPASALTEQSVVETLTLFTLDNGTPLSMSVGVRKTVGNHLYQKVLVSIVKPNRIDPASKPAMAQDTQEHRIVDTDVAPEGKDAAPKEPSFFTKYWYLPMLAMLAVNLFVIPKQKRDEPGAQAGTAAPAKKQN